MMKRLLLRAVPTAVEVSGWQAATGPCLLQRVSVSTVQQVADVALAVVVLRRGNVVHGFEMMRPGL